MTPAWSSADPPQVTAPTNPRPVHEPPPRGVPNEGRYLHDDPIFAFVDLLFEVVPPILVEHGKAKNPWPNVDAQSGVIQWHYGVKEYDFYTVLFGIGRAIGVLSNIVWDRALGYPIERPKSLTTDMLERMVEEQPA